MSKVLLVGEAWGEREDRFQHAFVGPSGALLARLIGKAGFTPEFDIKFPSELDMIQHWKRVRQNNDVEIANVFNFRPTNNNVELCFTSRTEGGLTTLPPLKPGKYLRPELLFHVENLWQKIADEKPNLIIPLGNPACWAILGEAKIGTIRGAIRFAKKFGVKTLPTYHPAAILRQENLRTVVLKDLIKARKESEFAEIRRTERYALIEPTLDEIRDWSARPAEFYAIDIETFTKTSISMIGFARSPDDALVIQFYDEKKENGSYWSIADEVEVWKHINRLLRKPIPKVFQNGVFDLSHLLRARLRPTMCDDDTMLLHHALYPEMLKGLGFLGSIYANEIAWKRMRTQGDNLKRDE